MSLFGKVFGNQPGAAAEEEESEVERLLQQVAESRHAGDRRDAMAQLGSLLQDNPRAQYAISSMGLPVLLSVLAEDRDDLELLKGALECLQLSVALPEASASEVQQQQQQDGAPQPALINADLFCRAPDNVLLLLGLLRPEPEGCEDFYVRYGALQALNGLLRACPDKMQACVLSSPLGVIALMDLLSQPLEVLRNEALLLLVGLCSGCPQIANIAAFEGAFDKLLAICGAEGGPAAGDVIVQDAAELLNNLLRGNQANQRLFREMGHINQLPALLSFTPPPPPPPSAAAGLFSSATQYMDPSLRAAAGAAANAAANSAVGAAAAAAVAAAGAAAAVWPAQVAANYLCLLETVRLLLVGPHSSGQEQQQSQEVANRRANQDKLGQLGLMQQLVCLSIPGAPSAAVRAQALFCLGDLVWGHAQLQEQLAGQLAAPTAAPGSRQQQQPIPYLQAVLRVMLHSPDELDRSGASHLLAAFCQDNRLGQMAVLSTVAYTAAPQSFGEELLAALLCQHPAAAATGPSAAASTPSPGKASAPPTPGSGSNASTQQQQLAAGQAAAALSDLLQDNPLGQAQLLALQVPEPPGPGSTPLLARVVQLLRQECGDAASTAAAGGAALSLCCRLLRLLIAWCSGCSAAGAALLAEPGHLQLLVELVGRRGAAAGDVHIAGLAAVLLGVCLINAPGSPATQQQQQLHLAVPAAAPSFDQLLDVLLSQVGLSQWYGALDDMKASPAFQAAQTAPKLPTHITRSVAAALLEAEAAGVASAAAAAAAAAAGGAGAAFVGGALGLLTSATEAAGGGGPGAAAGGQHVGLELQPYDQQFTAQVEAVAAAVQQLTLNAFSGSSKPAAAAAAPAPPSAGTVTHNPLLPHGALPHPPAAGPPPVFTPITASAGGAAARGVTLDGPTLPPHQQHHHAHKLPIPQLPIPQLPIPQGATALPQQQQQQPQVLPPQLLPLPQQQQQPVVPPQQQPQLVPQQQQPQQQQPLVLPEGRLGAIAAELSGDTAQDKLLSALESILQLQGQVEELRSRNRSLAEDLIRVSQSKPGLIAAAGAAGAMANGGPIVANGAAAAGGAESAQGEADARIAAQLRASRAEMEAGTLRQQLQSMQARWSALEADAAAAREGAAEAAAAAGKAEADLAALSSAYNDLEEHVFKLEEQLKQQQQQQQQQGAEGQQPAAGAADTGKGAAGGAEDIDGRIAAAAAEARAAAEAEAGEEMEDLLACLGEEQAKVEVLSGRLLELGEDVEALLAAVAVEQEADGGAAADDNEPEAAGTDDQLL